MVASGILVTNIQNTRNDRERVMGPVAMSILILEHSLVTVVWHCLWGSPRLYILFVLNVQCLSLCQVPFHRAVAPLFLLTARLAPWEHNPLNVRWGKEGLCGTSCHFPHSPSSATLRTLIWEHVTMFDSMIPDKYGKIRNHSQSPVRWRIWFVNVGISSCTGAYPIASLLRPRRVTGSQVDPGTFISLLHNWFCSALQQLAGFHSVRSRLPRESCASGWKLSCEVGTPTASVSLLPVLWECLTHSYSPCLPEEGSSSVTQGTRYNLSARHLLARHSRLSSVTAWSLPAAVR